MSESEARRAAIIAKRDAGQELDPTEIIAMQTCQVRELQAALRDESAARQRVEAELREVRDRLFAEGQIRPSVEVLQRMANGIDPFDLGRFKCAVAALPHETPKLSATMNHSTMQLNIGARLDAAQKRKEHLRLIEGGPDAA